MKSFMIKKINDKLELQSFSYDVKGFTYKPKTKKSGSTGVSTITIVNPVIINALICSNFNKKYKKVLALYLSVCDRDDEDGTSEGQLMLALDEVAHLKEIITKYHALIFKKEEERFLKRLKILENEIRGKIVDFKLIKEESLVNNNIIEEERGMSR